MFISVTRAALIASVSAIALPHAAFATAAVSAADATAEAATTRDSKGQANDKGALTTSDIIVTGSRAAQDAPITASLTTTQPQSAVSRTYIDNAVATADFNQIIALTPGVTITGTSNGVGFTESKAQIRGFQDGEYNVTYDSVPFADTNNPTHHSTAFFPSNTIETIVVDRGPGNASQLGQATYGGNLNIYSRAVSDEQGGQIEGILGNWNTFIGRAEYQSGKIESLGGAQFVVTGQFLRSDGALTFSPVNSKNIFAKAVIPIGASNTLTIVSTYNRNFYYQSDTVTGLTCGSATRGATVGGVAFANAALDSSGQLLTQLSGDNCAATSLVGQFGKNYSLSNDRTRQDYYKFNRTDKTTDFSIIRLQSELAKGLTLDNRVYMYAYTNNTLSGQANTSISGVNAAGVAATGNIVTGFVNKTVPVSATNPNGILITPVVIPTATGDVSGYDKGNKYRTVGYIGQLTYEFGMGKIRAGGWYERAATDRRLFDLDATTGLPNYREAFNNGSGLAAQTLIPSSTLANIRYLQHSGWRQYQLFGEFEFHPFDGLSITPGVKYVHFTRSIDAVVNQNASRSPNRNEATWTKTLPFLTANWAITPAFAIYGQYAQGMYVPDLSSFYTPSTSATEVSTQNATLASLKPQTTANYQAGGVWHSGMISVDADVYLIEVDNKIAADPTIGTVGGAASGTLVNIGKIRYKGVEGQISVVPIAGLTLFANGGLNEAKSLTTNQQIQRAAKSNAGLGVFYASTNGFRASFTQKFTGPAYANEYNGIPGTRLYRIRPYSIGDFSISQEVGAHFRIGMTVGNVFNSRAVTAIATSASGAPTTVVGGATLQSGYGQSDSFSYLPPRSAEVSVRLKF